MNLRVIAEADLGNILEDQVGGFGRPIKLYAPDGASANLIGFINDIALAVDPETGELVTGRNISVALRISTITAALPNSGLPEAIAETTKQPWIIEFENIQGINNRFKVYQSAPDRTLGLLTLMLEFFQGKVLGIELFTPQVLSNPFFADFAWTELTPGQWKLIGDGSVQPLNFLSTANQPENMRIKFTVETIIGGSFVFVQTAAPFTITSAGTFVQDINKTTHTAQEFRRAAGVITCTISAISLRELIA